MKSLFSLLISLALLSSNMKCSDENNLTEELSWILNDWYSAKLDSYESWQYEDGQLNGKGYKLVDGDTIVWEKLHIHYSGKNILYTVDVKHNPEPVDFTMKLLENHKAVFENPVHDFPQKISYSINDEGNLKVVTSGIINGEEKSVELDFVPVDKE